MADLTAPARQTYRVTEAATILGVGDTTIRRMVANGDLPTITTSVDVTVIPRWAIDQLVARPQTIPVPVELLRGLLLAAAAGANIDQLVDAAHTAGTTTPTDSTAEEQAA